MNRGFADYIIPVNFEEEEEFEEFLSSQGVDLEFSFGLFTQDELVGFVLNASLIYQGNLSLVDVATAIIPEQRGKGGFTRLYTRSVELMRARGITHYYLEVLEDNDQALSIYLSKGFHITRSFLVVRWIKTCDISPPQHPSVQHGTLLEWYALEQSRPRVQPVPCYEHSDALLLLSPDAYQVSYLGDASHLAAACIYGLEGRIVQLCYDDIASMRVVLESVLAEYEIVVAKNIDTSYSELVDLLDELGFGELTRQYEMLAIL